MRDAHAGDNGCVEAIFRVDSDITKELRHGVFAAPGKEFNAWIRFSNGNSEALSPRLPDARGMAIKLMGVDGLKFPDGSIQTTDAGLGGGGGFWTANGADIFNNNGGNVGIG